ncbi:hypothetical protein [Natranaerobius trueperi]|uniref:Uncharacterized protein n=1 Tax=Natranaerobius trueperi TaxID=759412 RepID=A0A226C3I4_9FIRM|nr:hypothetical protein [Natranaerobius trueperi]OWZ84970.1 hypothetical protein CDO51_00770 [Natranaerobius trueperi]
MTKKVALLLTVVILGGLFVGQAVLADVNSDPGSQEDPLVTESYVNDVMKEELRDELEKEIFEEINELKTELDERLANLDELDELEELEELLDIEGSDQFEVVQVSAGDTIIGGASSEMILRAGSGSAVATTSGGLADLTAGVDIQDGEDIPQNHSLLIARDDGRGISVRNDAVIMVRGEYDIK